MFQEITEETLKIRPLYSKKKSHQLNLRVRYQAIAMAGDGDGFYGYAEAIRKQDRAAERAAKSRASLNRRQIEFGYPPLNNPRTIPRDARGQKGSLKIVQHSTSTSKSWYQWTTNGPTDAENHWSRRLSCQSPGRPTSRPQLSPSYGLSHQAIVNSLCLQILIILSCV